MRRQAAFAAQAVVDNGSHLIVAAHVSDAVNDKQQIAPALEHLEAAAPAVGRSGAVLADTGYHSAANLALCEVHDLVAFIAEGRQAHNRPLATVKTVFGVIKQTMGLRRFHQRGLHTAGGEWTLVSLAWNLKQMHALAAST